MKPVAALALLLATASSASAGAGWLHSDPARPFNLRMAQLPRTDADLDRTGRRALQPHNFFNDVVGELNIRDGKVDIFDEHQFGGAGGSEFSGSLDAHGATFRLRW
jgi:hypothetical protein